MTEDAFWAWMDAYVDEPHNASYEVPDMQRAYEAGQAAMPAEIERLRARADPASEDHDHAAEIASLTDQRNRVSDTADRLRAQLRAVKAIADQHALGDTPRALLAQAVLDQLDADL